MAARFGPVRDAFLLVAVFSLLFGGLYLYAGTWPPAVIIESGSMMHADADVTYGRIGTIDPGDLVVVKAVSHVRDVETFVENGPEHYGKPGDVIVYFPHDDRATTPIIHRAIAYVEVASQANAKTYRVRWDPDAPCVGGATKQGTWCVYGERGINIPSIPVRDEKPTRSGFLTKGDNPRTNTEIDQDTSLTAGAAVELSWIEGKARGELPWLGLIKLSVAPTYNQGTCVTGPLEWHWAEPARTADCRGWVAFGHAYAPKDLWTMLGVSLGILILGPMVLDLIRRMRARRVASAAPDGHEPPR